MKTWHIVLLVFGCVLVGLILFIGIPTLISFNIVKDTMDNSKKQANEMTAELIVNGVEFAYTSAYMENLGNPTLEQVKSHFQIDNAVWTNNYKIQSNEFDCDVEVINNYLKVKCLNAETSTDMILSK